MEEITSTVPREPGFRFDDHGKETGVESDTKRVEIETF